MLENIQKIKSFPDSVKFGIYFITAAWAGHWIFFCAYFFRRTGNIPGDLFLRHFLLGSAICFFLIRQKAWARWLGIMGNLIILVYYLVWFFSFQMHIAEMAIMVAIMILFGLSTYQLFRKGSSEFFKSQREASAE
jgi:hypothetical protein